MAFGAVRLKVRICGFTPAAFQNALVVVRLKVRICGFTPAAFQNALVVVRLKVRICGFTPAAFQKRRADLLENRRWRGGSKDASSL
jgi:hypothetical protein